jgi:hypothetical protein
MNDYRCSIYLLSLHDQVVVDEFDCVSVAAGRMRLGEGRLTMMKRAGKKENKRKASEGGQRFDIT